MIRTITKSMATACLALSGIVPAEGAGPVDVDWSAELISSAGRGKFAPYYLTANRGGLLTQSGNILADLKTEKKTDLSRRFSYGFGAEVYGGISSAVSYSRYLPDGNWTAPGHRPSPLVLQQIYATVKWRGVFVTAGVRSRGSAMLNDRLSSGDLIQSGNARGLPEARAGFIDFQNIPFTGGWLQLQGEAGYGRFIDADWISAHSNFYNGHVTNGSLLNYKRWYFRTMPSQPVSVTVGAQCICIFGGTTHYYKEGVNVRQAHHSAGIKDFVEVFFPIHHQEDFRLGNTIGSWDLKTQCRLSGGTELSAYFQWLWDDGSGLGRRNGWDGLWGVEYKAASPGWIDGAVIEYLDLTNQSGSLHWAPGDRPGTTITGQATGADDYYNNAYYNAYANFGMAIGTPFVKSPIYNTDGYMQFETTRMRGVHAAAEGHPGSGWDWRAAASYRKAWGNGKVPLTRPQECVSVMIEAGYELPRIAGLRIGAALGADRGSLLGSNTGVQVTVRYSGSLTLKK